MKLAAVSHMAIKQLLYLKREMETRDCSQKKPARQWVHARDLHASQA